MLNDRITNWKLLRSYMNRIQQDEEPQQVKIKRKALGDLLLRQVYEELWIVTSRIKRTDFEDKFKSNENPIEIETKIE